MKETSFYLIIRVLLLAMALLPATAAAQYSRGDHHYNKRFGHRGGDVADVRLERPGTLEERLGAKMYDQVRVLRIEGGINEADIRFIKKLCSRSRVLSDVGRSVDNYLDLDLEYAWFSTSSRSRDNAEVPSNVFSYVSHLRSVVLPDRVRVIRSSAFRHCYHLEEVIMPPTVRVIEDNAFEDCERLNYITIGRNLDVIGRCAFKDCEDLRDFYFPSTVREIGSEAFMNVPLTRADLPRGLELIGKNAFRGTRLTEISIPVRCRIEENRIGHIATLQSFYVENGNADYNTYQGALYNRNGTVLYQFPPALSVDCRVPDGVEEIAANAFNSCRVTSVDLPASVTRIGAGAFLGSAVTVLNIPDGVTRIAPELAENCKSLRSVSLPTELIEIGKNAFHGCTALTEIEMPNQLNTLGEKAFAGCIALRQISLPEGLTTLQKETFTNCEALTSVLFPSTLLSIEEKALSYCARLTNPALPGRLSKIGKNAFRDCSSITQLVTPASCLEIGQEAFRGCSALTDITLTKGLQRIGDNAFRGTPLSRIILPASTVEVGKKIAEKCPNLLRVECHAVNPPVLHKVSNDKVELYVPSQSVEAYRKAKNWKNYKVIKPL